MVRALGSSWSMIRVVSEGQRRGSVERHCMVRQHPDSKRQTAEEKKRQTAEENGSMMEDRDWNASNEVGCQQKKMAA
jgi:hypothetical protein